MLAVFFLAHTLQAQQVLLIPDSSEDSVRTYCPFDGSLIDPNFILSGGEMSRPFNAIDSGSGTILVSDQIADAVFEYGFDGTFLGTVLDIGDTPQIQASIHWTQIRATQHLLTTPSILDLLS